MLSLARTCWMLSLAFLGTSAIWADDEKPRDDKRPGKEKNARGVLTALGTVRGEITKVSDGGHKIEVTYKELVPARVTRSELGLPRIGGRARFSNQNYTLKEKDQEIEMRLLESTKVRLMPQGADDYMKKQKKESEKEAADAQENKKEANPNKKTEKKSNLPGKEGEPSQLSKGQFVIVNVAREDFPNFSRYVATMVIVVGEK